LLIKRIQVIPDQGNACPDKIGNLMWMKADIPGDESENSIDVVKGNAEKFETRSCAYLLHN